MNKIVNKALFYKEWINVRWVTLLTVIVLLYFNVFGVMSQLNMNRIISKQGGVGNLRWFNNGLYGKDTYFFVMVFVIVLLSVILFIGEKTSETQGFMASMPFTRKEIILNKWFVGVLSIIISFVVTYIFLSLFYASNINSINTVLNPYSDIVKWFFINMIQYICIFTFMMLIQSVMGNSIVSGIVGAIILLVPWFVVVVVKEIITQVTKQSFLLFDKASDWINIYGYNLAHQEYFNVVSNNVTTSYINYDYNDYILKVLILSILTCLFLYLSFVSYKKRNLEYNLKLIAFKSLEPVFIGGVSLCSGLLGAVFGQGYSSESSGVFWIWAGVFAIAGYFISKLSIKVFSSGK